MPTPFISDVYRRLASHILGISEPSVTAEQRATYKKFAQEAGESSGNPYTAFLAKVTSTGAKTSLTAPQMGEISGLLELVQHDLMNATPWISTAGKFMPLGVYDHFKGGIYLVDRVELCADTSEFRVSYLSLVFATYHSRRANEWNEIVVWPDGKYRSRFVLRGNDLKTPEPPFKVATPVDSRPMTVYPPSE